MSKHNNNLSPCLDARCSCGRYITIGEWYGRGQYAPGYKCPDCTHRQYAKPISSEEHYKQFNLVRNN